MIATLSGELKHVVDNRVIVEVGGVGYEVSVSRTTLNQLPATGSDMFLHTHLHVREDEMRLFGFATIEEKSLFLLLTSLSKVGVKTALEILSTYTSTEFRQVVLQQDITRMTKVSGVGRKTAERMLFELKERLEQLPGPVATAKHVSVEGDVFEEAVQGMVYLGCKYPVAAKAIQQAMDNLGKDAPLEDLLREGLKYR